MHRWLFMLLVPCGVQAERIDGRIASVSEAGLRVRTGQGVQEVRIDALTEMSWSNTWHSLEALPAEGLTAQIHLDTDEEKALRIGPELLERASRQGLIAVNERCLRLTRDDRVDHLPTGDYPVWVGLLRKDKAGVFTLTVDKKSYTLEIKAERNLGWYFSDAKPAELKPGRKVVVIGKRGKGVFKAEQILLPGTRKKNVGR